MSLLLSYWIFAAQLWRGRKFWSCKYPRHYGIVKTRRWGNIKSTQNLYCEILIILIRKPTCSNGLWQRSLRMPYILTLCRNHNPQDPTKTCSPITTRYVLACVRHSSYYSTGCLFSYWLTFNNFVRRDLHDKYRSLQFDCQTFCATLEE